MKKFTVAILVGVCCSSLAIAADETSTGQAAGKTTSQAEKGAGDTGIAKEFWAKYAKDGYLSKEDALKFKGADGKSVDMQKLDADNDGKISQREWTVYHETAGAAGVGSSAKDKTTK